MKTRADFRDYQRKAEHFLVDTRRCYLAAKAGAGKTAVALAAIDQLMLDRLEVRRTLVVAPRRVVPQWPVEAAKWSFGQPLTFSLYTGSKQERAAAAAARTHVLVCSFEFFPELVKSIKAKDWTFDLVVFDEASRLRNGGRRGSVGWKTMNAISAKTQARIVLMSGSPRPGTAHELFAPVFLLDRGARLGTTLTGFRADYLEPNKTNRNTGQVYSWRLRAGMEWALYSKIEDLYFAVAPDLGLPSVVIDRPVTLPSSVVQICRDLQRGRPLDLDELELTAASAGTVTGKLHQISGGACFDDAGRPAEFHDEKLAELQEIIGEVDGPVVVAYWYTHERDRLLARIPGAVDITTEQGLAQAKRGEVPVALLHPASAGHGVDGLQEHYSAIVWYSIPASFELYDQTNKRLIRSGQPETVRVYRIVAANVDVDWQTIERLAVKEAEQDDFYEHLEGKA